MAIDFQIAVYGKVFNHSGRDAWELFQSTGVKALVAYDCSGAILLMGTILGGLMTGTCVGGIGSTIGTGIYILVGIVAREHSGPGLTLSFLIAGIKASLSAFCYAELSSCCPSAGSAYHYSYICLGEVFELVTCEYTIGVSTVARGISPNSAMLFGGADSLPFFLARQTFPVLNIVVDPCAALLVFVVTRLLCVGIKENFPFGEWHCVYCSCKFYGATCENSGQMDESYDMQGSTLLSCRSCEQKYHQRCILENSDAHADVSSSSFLGRNF